MPQNGFHGLIGLAMARGLVRRVPQPKDFAGGLILGAMLPDIDMYPTAIAVLLGRGDLTYVIHRSATHSLFFALALLIAGALAPRHRWLLLGLSLGILSHILLDIAFWFAPIDLFWPFGEGGLHTGLPKVDLWAEVPLLFRNLRQSVELAAFALMLGALRRIAKEHRLLAWERLAWAWFAVALITAFLFTAKDLHENLVVMTPYLLLFLPLTWWWSWKLRGRIAEWGGA